jgi:glycosyltransferase involved in cell wall biosynthesis
MNKMVVIVPALNEVGSIGGVVRRAREAGVHEVVVCDNGSTDGTAVVAREAGAVVVVEPRRGYGYACLAGMGYLAGQLAGDDVVVFVDGDGADDMGALGALVHPIVAGEADMVIGSRVLGIAEVGSLTATQRFGNWLATRLIGWIYGVWFTDLGPFRAIRWSALVGLGMEDTTYGWTVEMQVKAAKGGLRSIEVGVNYRCREHGRSKVSGNVKGMLMAGYKILWTIFKLV